MTKSVRRGECRKHASVQKDEMGETVMPAVGFEPLTSSNDASVRKGACHQTQLLALLLQPVHPTGEAVPAALALVAAEEAAGWSW